MKRRTVLVAAAATLLAAGCSGGAGSGNAVDVSLKEFSITPSVTTTKGDTVTFEVHNDGAEIHEMVVVKTDVRADKIPMEGAEASERGSVGEVADLTAGESKSLELKLSPGHYVLLCNLPGHYLGGMHVDFTVS